MKTLPRSTWYTLGVIGAVAVFAMCSITCRYVTRPVTSSSGDVSGAQGDTLVFFDSLVVMYIPPGALTDTVTISADTAAVAPLPGYIIPATSVTLQPDTLTFAAPVTIAIRAPALPAGANINQAQFYSLVGGGWQPLGGVPDSASNGVRGSFSELGVYALGFQDSTTTGTPQTPWWQMDFSRYAGTDSLFNDRGGNYGPDPTPAWFSTEDDNIAGNVFLDTDHPSGANWTKSMRYVYHTASVGACNSITVGRDIRSLPTQSARELWIELYVKFSSNFDVLGAADGCPTPADFKMFFGLSDAGGRWELKWGWQGTKDIVGGWPGDEAYPKYAGEQNRDGGPGAGYWDGKWHRVRLHWKFSSDTSTPDGIYVMEVDGKVLFQATDLLNNTTGTFNGLAYGRNLDGMNTQDDSLWWGRTRVWATNPGWGF